MVTRFLALACALALPGAAFAQELAKPRLDAHGFPLPDGALARLGDLRFAQRGSITGIAISPDGKTVATGGDPQRGYFQYGEWPTYSIYFWNVETGRITREVPVAHDARPVTFSSDGKLLAVGYDYGLTVLNVETGKEHWPRGAKCPGPVDPGAVHFLDNDRLLAVRTHMSVEVWDVAKGAPVRKWEAVPVKDNALLHRVDGLKIEGWGARPALSPSGKTMAWLVGIRKGNENWLSCAEVHVFDTLTGERKHTSPQIQGFLFGVGVALLDEGETVLLEATLKGADRAGGQDIGGNVALDVKTGKEKFRVRTVGRDSPVSEPGPIGGERFHKVAPDGKSYYTWGVGERGTGSRYLRRDSATGKQLGDALAGYDIAGYRVFAFTPDGKGTVVAFDKRWALGDLDLKPRADHAERVRAQPGATFLSADRVLHNRKIWDRTGKLIGDGPKPRARVYAPAPYSTGYPTSFDGSYRLIVSNVEQRLVVYDIEADRELCKLEGVFAADKFAKNWPVMSADGTRVLVPLLDGNDLLVNWFDTKTGHKVGSYRVAKSEVFPDSFPLATGDHVHAAAAQWFAEDASLIGYLTRDSRLAIVDTATAKVVRTIGVAVPFPKQPEEKPAPMPIVGGGNQPMFLPGAVKPPARAWSYWRMQSFVVAQRHPSEEVQYRNWVADEFFVFDPKTGAPLRRFALPSPWQSFRALSPDARFAFVRTGWDSVAVYETATGRARGTIRTDAGTHCTFTVAPDGKTLAVNCADTSALLFDLDRPLGGHPELTPADALSSDAGVYYRMLSEADPGIAEPALWALVRAPKEAVATLKHGLRPAEKPEPKLFEEPLVPDRTLRDIRALEVLERIGTADARKIVEVVAKGHPDALLTREAKLVLDRWSAKAATR
jgi:hypothetical protein